MIDANGHLRCSKCGKKLGEQLIGKVEIVCPRCKTFNVFQDVVIADGRNHPLSLDKTKH